ncbi:hypothetical protein BOTCAL_0448g00110 [Botryotinia calthae]|uniref:Uncharacterized protein n=1 Tax=Botryotinia calthae TaxID=38488 RepID=A0A4Y8CQQ9_9HELO|nr:hypothetical protein BOTCAL_0448g00110 [Botryotinia calthae]
MQKSVSSLANPVAIIGMSFVFPRDANSADGFWTMLMQARCASEDFPESRLNQASFYHSDVARQDSLPFHGGHFLAKHIATFDAPFFSISAQEAMGMDPLQRGLLETTYRALENAGLSLETVVGSKTSVYTGCFTTDWRDIYAKDPDQWPSYAATGVSTLSMCANRISWFFNLRGTSANIDTACSSSLVALDMACRDLQTGESTMAIVGAGNLMYSPDFLHLLQSMNMVSVDSKCYSFDDRANGYARGEGFAVIVLKSVDEAISARDTLRAIIRATGTNQDGRTQLVTQPSGDAHEILIKDTYRKAGLHPSSASYIEAHGTGTPVGEANSIGRVFREHRRADNPLIVGAVKSNIGHLEGASGLAGLIKTVLILERAIIPPNTNFTRQNMAIDGEYLKIMFPTSPVPWPHDGQRIASVNSFGYGGSNAHVILQDAYHYLRDNNMEGNHVTLKHPPLQIPEETQDQPCSTAVTHVNQKRAPPTYNSPLAAIATKLLIFSAADEEGIKRTIEAYNNHFRKLDPGILSSESYWDNVSYTLDSRRSSLPWKCFGVFNSIENLQNIDKVISHPTHTDAKFKPSFTFVFTGQGAQWPRMGVELMERYNVFGQYLEMCSAALKSLGCPWSLIEELHRFKATSKIDFPEYSQPLCTALQIAYIELLRTFNIVPETVLGHSSGEIAAAYSAGALSLQYAMKVAYYKGLLATDLEDDSKYSIGAMMAVGLSETDVQHYFDAISMQYGSCSLVVACINSQSSITVSGDRSQIVLLESMLLVAKIFARKLQVSVAYHSPLMAPIASKYMNVIGDMKEKTIPLCNQFKPKMISSVTGGHVKAKELQLGSYWIKNMLAPVNFLQAMNRLCQVQCEPPHKIDGSHRSILSTNTLIEIGPHSALQGPIREILSKTGADWIEYYPVLKRNQSAIDSILDVAGRLHCRGFSKLNFTSLNRPTGTSPVSCLTDLPGYEFNHSRNYWWESRISKQYRLRGSGRLDLLGKQTPDWVPHSPRWRNFIKISEMPWVEHHKVNGSILYPAAGMLVMAIEAAHQVASIEQNNRIITGFSIKNTHFSLPLIIPTTLEGIETQFHLHPKRSSGKASVSDWSEFMLFSWENDQCIEICHGFVRVEYGMADGLALHNSQHMYGKDSSTPTRQVNHEELYQALNCRGYEFGTAFQSLSNIHFNGDTSKANVKIFDGLYNEQLQPHIVHPATLDGIFHLGLASLFREESISSPLAVPTFIKMLRISKEGLSSTSNGTIKAYSIRANSSKSPLVPGTTTEFSGFAFNDSGTKLLVEIVGLRLSAIESPPGTDMVQAEKPMCHSLSWFPDISLSTSDSIMALCRSRTNNPDSDSSSVILIIKDLEIAAFVFISRALISPISSCTEKHIEKYLMWAKRHLEKLAKKPAEFLAVKQLLEDETASNDFICRVEAASGRGKLIVKVGRSLHGILSGEIDPLELLFDDPEDLVRQTYTFYNDITSTHWKKLLNYMKLVTQQNPNMNVLEIGAGTGATTEILMKVLIPHGKKPLLSRYSYTDISAAFFDEAKRRFGSRRQVDFKTLNIELDPGSQGFKEGSYDLIVASNVLHATRNMRQTMKNVRYLLKPGGKLILYEGTNIEVIRTSFVFGLLPGWWLGEETFRPWGATMTSEVWKEILLESGFSGIDMIVSDYESGSEREFDIMISTASPLIQTPEFKVFDIPQQFGQSENSATQLNESASPIRNGLVTLPIRKRETFHLIVNTTSQTQTIIAHQLQYEFSSRQNINNYTELTFQITSLSQAAKLQHLDTVTCIFLLETDQPFLHDMKKEQFTDLQHVISSSRGNLWLNCAGGPAQMSPSYALVDGFSRVIRSEFSAVFIVISFHITTSMLSSFQVETLFSILSKLDLGSSDFAYEPMYLEADGLINVGRVIEAENLSTEVAIESLSTETKVQKLQDAIALQLLNHENKVLEGGVSDLPTFILDNGYDAPLEADEIEIKVHSFGLSQKSFISSKQLCDDDPLAFCWSGSVTRLGSNAAVQYSLGQEVFMLKRDTCKTHIRGNISCTNRIPPKMSLNDAAILPLSFVTAWQCIKEVGRLEKGESILIHEATGNLLSAAVRISQFLGAEIFITTPLGDLRKILAETYNIPETHILHSGNDGNLVTALKRLANDGVDVVLNSATGESFLNSWDLIKPYGRFVDVSQTTFSVESELPMYPFKRGASLSSFGLSDWMMSKPGKVRSCLEKFGELSSNLDGAWNTSISTTIFPISHIKEALVSMNQNQTASEMVLEMNASNQIAVISKRNPAYSFEADATYVIAGGLGSIGREIARWMVTRGAENLILLSRSGPSTASAQEFISGLTALGVTVAAPACDIASLSVFRNTLEKLNPTMPSIKGCIQASMVLSDSTFQSMNYSQWLNSISPKVLGSWNLHTLLPNDLDFFICLSSVSGIVGLAGQSNYASGNTYLDSLARYRIHQGQKATSIILGVVDEDGYLSENPVLKEKVLSSGPFAAISRSHFFDLLNYFCNPNLERDIHSCNPIIGLQTQQGKDKPSLQKAGIIWKSWAQSPMFSMVRDKDVHISSSDASSLSSQSLQTVFVEALSSQAAFMVVLEALVSKIARMTGGVRELIDPKNTMNNYGVDSLVAIEIRKWAHKEFAAEVAVFDIVGGGTFWGVAGLIVEKSELR